MDLLDVVDDVLEHHGTKGMRWGIRKEKTGAQKDSRWFNKGLTPQLESGMQHKRLVNRVANEAGRKMRPEVKALNKSPEFSSREAKRAIKKEHFSKGFLEGQAKSPIANKYNKAVSDIYMKQVKIAAAKHLEVSPSGKWEDKLVVGKGYWSIMLKRVDEAKHAGIENPDLAFRVRPIFDEDGYIVDVEFLDDTMMQSDDLAVDFLSHHGIKGMRWGVRRSETAGSQEVIVSDRRKRIKTTGGVGVPAHPDAIKVSKIGQVQRKSGTKALSNQELQDYTKRLQLEQSAKRLSFQNSSIGKKFVLSLLGQTGKNAAQGVANDVAAKQVKKHMAKLAIAAAV